MDLRYSAEYELFRAEVKDFLAAHWVAQAKAPAAKREREAEFRQRATAAGYLYRGVPKKYGGSEEPADVLRGQIIGDEFTAVRAPREVPGVGTAMLVPTLLECGTESQKNYFIPKTLNGEYLWAQGYSEPNSGSDLASLKTRGELVGDHWIINGQKIWSTLAQKARFMFTLVRTEAATPTKHAGISYLLVDLKQPGVTVRALKQITGGEEFCEVFFDSARTPADWMVGNRGEGWRVSKATLSHERSALGGASAAAALFAKLVDMARETRYAGVRAIDHPVIRERLAVLDGFVQSHLYSGYRQLSMSAHGQDPGPVTLMNKLVSTDIGHDAAAIAKDLIGDALLLSPPAEGTRGAGLEKWINQFFGSLGMAIAGGTSNIQRNVIAERGYGLPRDDSGKADT